ncbi:MAG TPA: PadR family transcriptional regulator [Chthonomonadaceae bacterium]|nr:PadR family transcriptional regulator [Chthonomonadaceae bacterium]
MNLSDFGRFTDPSLLILISLADGPKHGYAITEDIAQFFGLRLGPGTLYGALSRLEAHGLIAPLPPEERRRPYRLTAAGATALKDQLHSLETITAVGRRRALTP